MNVKLKIVIASAVIVIFTAAAFTEGTNSNPGTNFYSILKNSPMTNISGYPTAYGNEPFVFYAIHEEGNSTGVYYVSGDYQKIVKSLKYGLYLFTCQIVKKGDLTNITLTNESWYSPYLKGFDGIIVPRKIRFLK